MFNSDPSNHFNASAEILIMLTGAFLLGLLLCQLLRKISSNPSHLKNDNNNYHHSLNIRNLDHDSQTKPHTIDDVSVKKNISDFTIINGITPKTEKILKQKNINSYSDLRDIDKTILKELLNSSSIDKSNKKLIKTWPQQAALAAKSDWRKLSEYQDFIDQETPVANDKQHKSYEKKDNLQKIKGIGPKIEKILNEKQIYSYQQLISTDASVLKQYIISTDSRFKNNQTATWSYQASMAEKGLWKELGVYQNFMDDINIDKKNLAKSIKNSKSLSPVNNQKSANADTDIKSSSETQNHSHTKNSVFINKSSIDKVKNTYNDKEKFAVDFNPIATEKQNENELTKLEGIDSEIENILHDNGIHSFKQLHKYDRNALKDILKVSAHDSTQYKPKSWQHQAGMAAREEWNDLKSYQSHMTKTTLPNAKKDHLQTIEGIGPKIELLLNDANILTFKDLKNTDIEIIRNLIKNAGSQYRMHNPETWPQQAEAEYNKKI